MGAWRTQVAFRHVRAGGARGASVARASERRTLYPNPPAKQWFSNHHYRFHPISILLGSFG
ncbi:hypothetical protein RHCRD62_60178 [Rhodococcus sp. RD6.2]|nr:hypothetical protein RHCRD62_60178 [Rhodococcus sp. RD6.2]